MHLQLKDATEAELKPLDDECSTVLGAVGSALFLDERHRDLTPNADGKYAEK